MELMPTKYNWKLQLYNINNLISPLVTREEEGLMPSPFTILDFFLKTKFKISSCVRGIALRS